MDQHSGPPQSWSEATWNHLEEVTIFIIQVYMKHWFKTPFSMSVSRNNLHLLSARGGGGDIHSSHNHLQRRSLVFVGDISGICLFWWSCDTQSEEEESEKPERQARIQEHSKVDSSSHQSSEHGLSDFMTTSMKRFFNILHINKNFLQEDPLEWAADEKYQWSLNLMKSIWVVSDLAELGVALIMEFNALLTKSKKQKQFLRQVVEAHHKKCRALNQSSSLEDLKNSSFTYSAYTYLVNLILVNLVLTDSNIIIQFL